VSVTAVPGALEALVEERIAERSAANQRFFEAEAERIARLCHAAAVRFARGGRLVAFGLSPADRSDVRHVAVEFVHPVIVGKRALPALGLTPEGGALALQAALVVRPDDIALAFGAEMLAVRDALAIAGARGALTIAFAPAGAEWEFEPPGGDPFIRQELVETLYHVLWELVHVFFEHRGLLEGREVMTLHDAGASSFLYPFLAEAEDDLDAVLDDVRRSVLMKSAEVAELRERTLRVGSATLIEAARTIRRALDAGRTLLALGNGGSATDAMDLVADFRSPPAGWPARRALDLTEDAAILTALANDIGPDSLFSRQIIAYGGAGDVALALSTSGNSRSVLQALAEARRRGLRTIAFVGYDGGRVLAEGLADHVVVTPSQHVPRIQEAQASAYHVLRELVERVEG
jgi:D-sedoheptulose 7-phosphate isomerase